MSQMKRTLSTRVGLALRACLTGLGRHAGANPSRRPRGIAPVLRDAGLLTVGLLFAACSPEPAGGPREELCAGSGCSEECRELDVQVCDIRERACQELVFQSVRCVRGSALSQLPSTDFVPQRDFGDPDAASEPQDAGVAELTPEVVAQAVWDEYLDEGLQLLHLIAKPLAVARAEEGKATGGVTSGGNVAIADNNADQLWWSMRLLAHEYVHTMQEYDYGGIGSLFNRYTRSSVTAQGVQAFIEGEAELYAWLAHAFMRNQSMDDWNLEEYFDLDQKSVRTRVAATDSPWTTARQWQHYAIGARHLYKTWKLSKNIGVRSVLYNLNADFGAWAADFEKRKGPGVREADICEPAGNHTIVQDSLGPSGVFAILMAASRTIDAEIVPTEYAWRIATDLTEDVMRMYGPTYGGGISQGEWMEREANLAMCKPAGAGSAKGDAGVASVPSSPGLTVSDAATDAATASAVTASAVTSTAVTGDANGPETNTDETNTSDVTSDERVVCDAGYIRAQAIDDAGVYPVAENTPFPEVQMHLVPGAPTWVGWAFAFETKTSATAFAEWIADANWPTLRVEQRGERVTLRSRRAPTNDAERAVFDAWTCK